MLETRKIGLAFLAIMIASCTQGAGQGPTFVDSGISPVGSGLNGDVPTVPVITSEVQKLVYHVGPIDLPAHQQAEIMAKTPAKLDFQVTEPVWMTGFTPQIVNDRGDILSGNLLHKAILINKHEANPLCTTGEAGNPFAVASSTLTKVHLPDGFGYPLIPEDPLQARVVLNNHSDEDLFGVYFSFELETVPMSKTPTMNDVRPLLLDIDPCTYQALSIEPGKFLEQSKTFKMPSAGRLLVASGVLSDYGVWVSLSQSNGNTPSLTPFWMAQAELDDLHRLINLSPNPFVDESGKELRAGDSLVLGTAFDNFSDKWRNDATAAAMIYLAPSAE